MIITHFGRQHFKLQVGDTVFALNPVSKEGTGKIAKYGADVCLISANQAEYNGVENVTHGDKVPYVIRGAGEYEVANIFIKAFGTETKIGEGKKEKVYNNASYCFTFDGIKITFLGALSTALLPEHKAIIDETDILFIPVGEDGHLLNAYDAHKLSVTLEPKIIIPMDYNEKSLPIFLKEAGAEGVMPVEKLTIKRKDLEGKLGEVVLFHEL